MSNFEQTATKESPVHRVIDKNHQIVRFSGGAISLYLEPSAGAPSFNLFDILRKALRPIVRSALQEALARKGPVTRDDVRLRISGQSRSVTVVVEPISDARNADEWLCVIVFQPALSRPGRQVGDGPVEEADSAQSYPSSSRHARSESFVSTMVLTLRSVPPTTAAPRD